MFDDATQRKVLEGVNDKLESGVNMLRQADLEEISEGVGLSLEQGKRLLGRLISLEEGPIVGEPITGNKHGLIGISVKDVYL